MKNAEFSKFLSTCNILRRVMAFLLCVVLVLSFVACKEDDTSSDIQSATQSTTQSNTQSSTQSETQSTTQSGTVSSESTGSKSEMTETVDINKGKIDITSDLKETVKRDDDGEVKAPVNPAGLSTNYVGGAEREANAMRNKILNTGNTEEYYTITGTKYYVSPGGNDENSGTSPQEAIRTIDGVNTLKLKAGDAVLFERGAVFRQTQAVRTIDGVIYGSYGKGEKPKLLASPMNFAEAKWQPSERKNIWKTMYIYDEAGSMVFEHGEEIGYLKTSVRNLTANTQFYFNESDGYMYLYCDKGNPSDVYESIEVGTKVPNFNIPARTGAIIDNICAKYSSWIGIKGHFNCTDVVVTNCEIGFVGGYLYGVVRAGNAIQCWQGVQERFVVQNCWIYQTFDTAVSWQGSGGEGYKYMNIVFDSNLTEYNNCDYEHWDHGATLGDFQITNNMMRFTALGWGTRIDDGGVRGIEGVFYADTSDMLHVGKVIVKNNVIDCPDRKVFDWEINGEDYKGNVVWDTWDKYYEISGTRVYWKQAYRNSTEIVRGTQRVETDGSVRGTTKEVIEEGLKRFDPTLKFTWIE